MTAFRWTGCWIFLPALFAVTSAIGANALTVRSGYPTSDLAATSLSVGICGPILAGFVALRFRRFPRVARTLRAGRLGVQAVFGAWWPLLLGGPLSIVAGLILTARTVPVDAPSWAVVLVDFVTALACGMVGLALAWAVPTVLAVPLAAGVSYWWLSYTSTTGNALLHNMNSEFTSCCVPETTPSIGALVAGLTVTGLVTAGVVLLLVPRRWADRSRLLLMPAVAGVVAVSLGAGAAAVLTLIAHPTINAIQPRTTEMRCRSAGVPTCVWPEDVGLLNRLQRVSRDLDHALSRWEFEPVGRLSQGVNDPSAVQVGGGDLSLDDVRYSIAAGYVDRQAGCQGAFGRWRDIRVALIAMAAGLHRDKLADSFTSDAVDQAVTEFAIANKKPGEVRRWFTDVGENSPCSGAR